jgi:hypothetical protein
VARKVPTSNKLKTVTNTIAPQPDERNKTTHFLIHKTNEKNNHKSQAKKADEESIAAVKQVTIYK